MSTKIYQAWRFKEEHWAEFIDFVHENMMNRVCELVKEMMAKAELTEENYKEIKESKNPKRVEDWLRLDKIEESLIEAAKDPRKSYWDIECGWNFWILDDYVYSMPIGPYSIVEYIKVPDFAEDYRYFNNTDRPKNISEKEWDERREMWNKINCGSREDKADHNSRRLYHSVVDFKTSPWVSQTDLQDRIIGFE